jgi:hypothetical protein
MWQFEVTTGKQIDSSGEVRGIGYAGGDCGQRPDGVNNPALENVKNVGPIPTGNYTADRMLLHNYELGHYVIHLSPDVTTRAKIIAYGRDPDSFFWHGDDVGMPGKRSASDGCIVGALDVRELFWNGADHELQVIAEILNTAS